MRYRCSFCEHQAASESAWGDHRRRSHPRPRRDYTGVLAPYLTHAGMYGVEEVFETTLVDVRALADTPGERVRLLALLGKRLLELDRRWRSPISLDYAVLFHDAGHDAQTIADLLGVTKATVQRRIRSVLEGSRPAEIDRSDPGNIGVLAAFSARQGDCPGYPGNAAFAEAA